MLYRLCIRSVDPNTTQALEMEEGCIIGALTHDTRQYKKLIFNRSQDRQVSQEKPVNSKINCPSCFFQLHNLSWEDETIYLPKSGLVAYDLAIFAVSSSPNTWFHHSAVRFKAFSGSAANSARSHPWAASSTGSTLRSEKSPSLARGIPTSVHAFIITARSRLEILRRLSCELLLPSSAIRNS
jgi:hypothetical protein